MLTLLYINVYNYVQYEVTELLGDYIIFVNFDNYLTASSFFFIEILTQN